MPVVLVALLLLVGGTAFGLDRLRDDEPDRAEAVAASAERRTADGRSDEQADDPAEQPTSADEASGPAPATSPEPTPPVTAAATTPLPPTPFFVAIVVSRSEAEGGRAAAEAFLPRIEQGGYEAVLLESSGYSHLRPGYWVAAAGTWGALAPAKQASADLQRQLGTGASVVYPRCVGSAAECAGSGA